MIAECDVICSDSMQNIVDILGAMLKPGREMHVFC